MSISIQLPQHFNFDDLVSEARAGRFNPEAFVQSVALDMSQTQFVGIGAAACLKALALRYQGGWPSRHAPRRAGLHQLSPAAGLLRG